MILVREREYGLIYEAVQSIEKVQCPVTYRSHAVPVYESGMEYAILVNDEVVWMMRAYKDEERHKAARRLQSLIMARFVAALKTDSLYYLEDLIREEDDND